MRVPQYSSATMGSDRGSKRGRASPLSGGGIMNTDFFGAPLALETSGLGQRLPSKSFDSSGKPTIASYAKSMLGSTASLQSTLSQETTMSVDVGGGAKAIRNMEIAKVQQKILDTYHTLEDRLLDRNAELQAELTRLKLVEDELRMELEAEQLGDATEINDQEGDEIISEESIEEPVLDLKQRMRLYENMSRTVRLYTILIKARPGQNTLYKAAMEDSVDSISSSRGLHDIVSSYAELSAQ